jgi:uracil-DNA glycosylase
LAATDPPRRATPLPGAPQTLGDAGGAVLQPRADPAALDRLLAEIRACRVCAAHLPLGPRPVLRASATARLLIVGQAPGTKVHATGIPWNDPSGARLRDWLRMDPALFYDEARIAIVPMGLCYPGVAPGGGDAPPRPDCARLWRQPLAALMPDIRLTLLVGSYAQTHALGRGAMTERVRRFRDHLPRFFPLPHPSWRTTGWERRHPWFAAEVLPALRQAVEAALA